MKRGLKLAGLVHWLCRLWALGLPCPSTGAELVLSEILFNPPSADAPHEYIELRGTPNYVLPTGTYLVSLEGDAGGNPGSVQNVFNLSGRALGGNGFLALLMASNSYAPSAAAGVLVNTNAGAGWGSGTSSSIGHRGEGGKTELVNASATFMLIRSPLPPKLDGDIDADNDGVPDGVMFGSWTVLDAVGALDLDGAGDIAYGLINFRRHPASTAFGTVVATAFTPSYVARWGNTTGWRASDWVAGDNLAGAAPQWRLGSTANTLPTSLAGSALNHLGAPNFNAPATPGVILAPPGGDLEVGEGAGTDTYTLALNTAPGGSVVIQISADAHVQISTDGGATFGAARTVTLTSTTPKIITVRGVDDAFVDGSPHAGRITHTITSGTASYPVSSLVPTVEARVIDNEFVLLSELKVNPPGSTDGPHEFVELRGSPGARLSDLYLLVVEGDAEADPGEADLVVNLDGARLGSNGLLMITAPQAPYRLPAATSAVADPRFSEPAGALGNGSLSFLLVSTVSPIFEGEDLDDNDDGTLEELPDGAVVLDAVAWRDGDSNDVVYGGAVLSANAGAPDAATRFASNNVPSSAAAWFFGDLAGETGDALAYHSKQVSDHFPSGTWLTPGARNHTAPAITPVAAMCGTIGDPTNPTVTFTIQDDDTPLNLLAVSAGSSNAAVVPDHQLRLTAGPGGAYALALDPVGVGYSEITLRVSDGQMTNQVRFPYAASAMGRPGGRFLIGASDGSTAIPVDDDWMFVGDDEKQILRLYARRASGLPVWRTDFTAPLDLLDIEHGVARETDIEGSTRVNQRLFWIGSHSHAEIGEWRTNRTRLFATDITGVGSNSVLSYVGRYDHLKADLIAWDRGNGHGRGAHYYGLEASDAEGVPPKAPDGSGFNIEGLALAPRSASVGWVGFRAPIVPAANRHFALIVPVLNFTDLAIATGPAGSSVFGAPIELDLNGRGIRSIEGTNGQYLIIAGPAGTGDDPVLPNDLKLYTWNGDPEELPQERAADLSGLNAEGIVALPPLPWTDQSQVQLVTDSGRTVWYGDGKPAKSLPEPNFKKCRVDTVTLGPVVKPAPFIKALTRSGVALTIRWRSRRGESYGVQWRAGLGTGGWVDLGGRVIASGPETMLTIEAPASPACFYRVSVWP